MFLEGKNDSVCQSIITSPTFFCYLNCMEAFGALLHHIAKKTQTKKTSTHSLTHGHTCTMSAGMHHQRLTLARFALWHCDLAVRILTQSLGLEVKEKKRKIAC